MPSLPHFSGKPPLSVKPFPLTFLKKATHQVRLTDTTAQKELLTLYADNSLQCKIEIPNLDTCVSFLKFFLPATHAIAPSSRYATTFFLLNSSARQLYITTVELWINTHSNVPALHRLISLSENTYQNTSNCLLPLQTVLTTTVSSQSPAAPHKEV